MKPQPLGFHEAVSRDLREAQDYYASWLANGARVITTRIEARLKTIARNAELFPEVYRNIRRAIVPRSYYGLFYRIRPGSTEILALIDLRRDPDTVKRLARMRTA